ncbi:MAG TPA: hypothetical protein VIV40_43305, partial [Kofleriaceae bacterium]
MRCWIVGMTLLVACGDDGQPPIDEPRDCIGAPPPRCSGGVITYCSFGDTITVTCEYGCSSTVFGCADPPDPRCPLNGSLPYIVYLPLGFCVGDTANQCDPLNRTVAAMVSCGPGLCAA